MGNSDTQASWYLEQDGHAMPIRAALSPSAKYSSQEPLVIPSIYLLESGLDGAHEDVQEAISDTIRCYRAGLYRPAATMLAKAMEGAWIELGVALAGAGYAPPKMSVIEFNDQFLSLAPITVKMQKVKDLCLSVELKQLRAESGVEPHLPETAWLWSDSLAKTRNAVHFGLELPSWSTS